MVRTRTTIAPSGYQTVAATEVVVGKVFELSGASGRQHHPQARHNGQVGKGQGEMHARDETDGEALFKQSS
jgi:hypothetical protein